MFPEGMMATLKLVQGQAQQRHPSLFLRSSFSASVSLLLSFDSLSLSLSLCRLILFVFIQEVATNVHSATLARRHEIVGLHCSVNFERLLLLTTSHLGSPQGYELMWNSGNEEGAGGFIHSSSSMPCYCCTCEVGIMIES